MEIPTILNITKSNLRETKNIFNVSHTIPTGNNKMLVIQISTHAQGTISSVTLNGKSFIKIREISGYAGQLSIWYLLDPDEGVQNIQINSNSSGTTYTAILITTFENVDQSNPISSIYEQKNTDYITTINTSNNITDKDFLYYGLTANTYVTSPIVTDSDGATKEEDCLIDRANTFLYSETGSGDINKTFTFSFNSFLKAISFGIRYGEETVNTSNFFLFFN